MSHHRSDCGHSLEHGAFAAYLPNDKVCANYQEPQQREQIYELHWRLQALRQLEQLLRLRLRCDGCNRQRCGRLPWPPLLPRPLH